MLPKVRLVLSVAFVLAGAGCHHFVSSGRVCRSYQAEIRGYEVTFIEAVKGTSAKFPRYAVFYKKANENGYTPRALGLDYDGNHAWENFVFCDGYIVGTIGCSKATLYSDGYVVWESDPAGIIIDEWILANFEIDREIAKMDLLAQEVQHATPIVSEQCYPVP